jgi:hypothetical protein
MLSMDVKGVRATLKRRAELFDEPLWGRVGPRARLHRFIRPEEFATLFWLRFRLGPWRRSKR